MKFARFFLLILSALTISASIAHAARQKPARPESPGGTYKGAIVLNAADGKVLYENNADLVSPPASMTKLMTFAVVSDRIRAGALALDTDVQITSEDAHMGGTQAYLDPREHFVVEELLYAMMIQSANDAAHALARAAAGSREAFVELMNAKARELGMTRTTFRTPHGLTSKKQPLSESDLTTSRDFAILCLHLVRNTDVLKYTSVRVREFAPDRVGGPLRMENHNKLLGRIAGVDGLKTGYTQNAGYCLSATAERNGRRVIVVIMGAFGPKGAEIDLGKSRDLRAIELLERGFAAIPVDPSKASTAPAPAAVPAVQPQPRRTSGPTPAPSRSAPAPTVSAPSAPAKPAPSSSPISPVSPGDESPVRPSDNTGSVEPAKQDASPAIKFELPPKPGK